MTPADTVRYWHSVELLQPQSIPALEARDELYKAFIHNITDIDPVLPWSEFSVIQSQELPKGNVWNHLLYTNCYDSKLAAKELERYFGADQGYKEPHSEWVALYAIRFTHQGTLVEDSLVLSSAAWLLAKIRKSEDWKRGFSGDQDTMREKAIEILDGVVTPEKLARLTSWIINYLALQSFFEQAPGFTRCSSTPVKPTSSDQEDAPLNSFILEDLADVSDSLRGGVTSEPLSAYLAMHATEGRKDLSDDRLSLYMIDQLSPTRYPSGCWPSENDLGLVHSQQLAVNQIVGELHKGAGIKSVNGPPGTGKTTLLRDVVAAVVTGRADTLTAFARASDVFTRNGRETAEAARAGGESQHCFVLDDRLFGHEIVVASANNGAVENITLELPQRDKIDESWLSEYDHFSELSELVSGKPAWGLISGAIGSKTNSAAFVRKFFWGTGASVNPDPLEQRGSAGDSLDENSKMSATDFADGVVPSSENSVPGSSDAAQKKPKGFIGWLNEQAKIERTTETRQATWQAAVKRYEDAKRDSEMLSAEASNISRLISALQIARDQVLKSDLALQQMKKERSAIALKVDRLPEDEWLPARTLMQERLERLAQHLRKKPRFLDNLLTLWGANRTWRSEHELYRKSLALAEASCEAVSRWEKRLHGELMLQDKSLAEAEVELAKLRSEELEQEANALSLTQKYGGAHVLGWIRTGVIGRGDAIELAEPWIVPGWHRARSKVFMEALSLHKTFFELEAKRIKANLLFITSMLQGTRYQGVSREAIRSAWATLFMVVPVLSSTFASFARSFRTLDVSEIGWLLMDESGQATPQQAVGALWRARRAVVVGDPLQLKPILNVSDAALEHLRMAHGVAPYWTPSGLSAQSLADQANPAGRMLGPLGMKTWVGLPLVVHRRCDRPMFDLSNRIAYDGAMVYGTNAPAPHKETPAELTTGWIDVRAASSGNWVKEEGNALRKLMAKLDRDRVARKDISVITPFKAVRNKLRVMLRKPMVFGTIHTMQGKESAIVILVLGGSSEAPGARDWAVSEPNLLNVAATRAKRRLYVIGDRADWSRRPMFCDVMDLLPRLELETSPSHGSEVEESPTRPVAF